MAYKGYIRTISSKSKWAIHWVDTSYITNCEAASWGRTKRQWLENSRTKKATRDMIAKINIGISSKSYYQCSFHTVTSLNRTWLMSIPRWNEFKRILTDTIGRTFCNSGKFPICHVNINRRKVKWIVINRTKIHVPHNLK